MSDKGGFWISGFCLNCRIETSIYNKDKLCFKCRGKKHNKNIEKPNAVDDELKLRVLDALAKDKFLTCPVCDESIKGEINEAVVLALSEARKQTLKDVFLKGAVKDAQMYRKQAVEFEKKWNDCKRDKLNHVKWLIDNHNKERKGHFRRFRDRGKEIRELEKRLLEAEK